MQVPSFFAAYVLLSVIVGSTVSAQSRGQSPRISDLSHLHDLKNDLSRSDLFELIIQAEIKVGSQRGVPDSEDIRNLFGPFTFPNDTLYDIVEMKPRDHSIFGIDISHYTPSEIPLDSLTAKNIRFVYMKASQGTSYKDGKFNSFWTRLGELPDGHRVHRGAYHFLTALGGASQQADTFLAVIDGSGGLRLTDMPPVLDLEWDIAYRGGPDRWAGQAPDRIIDKVLLWLNRVNMHSGRRPILYTSGVWWKERIGSEDKVARLSPYKIWIADYSRSARAIENPFVPHQEEWALWQFTASSRFATGFNKTVDANIFKGTEVEFYQMFNLARF